MFFNQTIQLIYVKIYFTSMKIKYVSHALDSKKNNFECKWFSSIYYIHVIIVENIIYKLNLKYINTRRYYAKNGLELNEPSWWFNFSV